MDDDILAIGLINLVVGVLALSIGYLYTLPRADLPVQMSAPVAIATGER